MELAGIAMLFAFPVGPLALGAYAWWRSRKSPPAAPAGDRLHRGVDWLLIAVSLIVLALFRFVLAPGVWV